MGIGRNAGGGYGLAVTLTVDLPGVDRNAAGELIAKAHEVCPYSIAVRGNVEVTLNVGAVR